MALTRDLLEKRSRLIHEMREISDKPAGNGGDLSDDQAAKFDTLKGELRTLEKTIERQQLLDDAERRMQGQNLTNGTGDDRLDSEIRHFSVLRAIASQLPDSGIDAGREREISAELARRSGRPTKGIMVPLAALAPMEQRVGLTTGDAGNLVGTDHRGDLFIDALRPNLVTQRMGARVLSGLRGDVDIPKLTGGPAAEWVAENTALTGGDHTFGQVTAEPHTVGTKTEYSRRTLLQADPSVEALVRSDFAAKLATALDLAAINGSGTGATPRGILQHANIATVGLGTNGAAPTWAAILQCIEEVQNAEALGGSLGWALNGSAARKMRSTLKESDSGAGYIMEAPGTLAGYQALVSSQVPGNLTKGTGTDLSALIFGDWSQIILAYWSAIEIMVNPYADSVFSKGNVLIRAFLDADVIVRHEEGFAAIKDMVTTP